MERKKQEKKQINGMYIGYFYTFNVKDRSVVLKYSVQCKLMIT